MSRLKDFYFLGTVLAQDVSFSLVVLKRGVSDADKSMHSYVSYCCDGFVSFGRLRDTFCFDLLGCLSWGLQGLLHVMHGGD